MKTAVFAGSFDPFTKGHEDIVKRALPLFDKIIIAIGINEEKMPFFSLDFRKQIIEDTMLDGDKVVLKTYTGLTGAFCKRQNAQFLIRGIRNSVDFQYESDLAQINKELFDVETVFFASSPALSHVSSSLVRELYKNKGEFLNYMP